MFRLRSVFTGVAGTPWYVNTHHEGDISSEAQAAAQALFQFWTTFKTQMVTPLSVQVDQTAVVIDPATGNQTGQLPVTTTPVQMTQTGDSLPHQIQLLVRLRTGSYVNGRQIQGKLFIPAGVTAVSNGQGVVNPNVVTGLAASAAALSTDSKLVVYSPTTHTATRVQSVSVWNQFATLNSRRD